MAKRQKKNTVLRVLIPVVIAALLAGLGYRTVIRWKSSVFMHSQRLSPRQSAERLCRRIMSRCDQTFMVKRLPGRTRTELAISDRRGQPLVLTNLLLGRLASDYHLQLLAAAEDRRNGRLSLVFGAAPDSLLWVTVQHQNPRADAALPARPRLALVVYDLPPENSRGWNALLRHTAVRSLIADHPLKTTARDVLIALPLEPIGYPKEDPGPGTILLDDSQAQLNAKLTRFSRYAPQPAGFAASQGSRALKDRRVTSAVMKFCGAGGLLFLEPRFTANSLARESARANGCRYLTATVYIEQQASAKSAAAALQNALARARAGKTVLALFPARDDILAAVDRLLAQPLAAGIDLVGVTALPGQ